MSFKPLNNNILALPSKPYDDEDEPHAMISANAISVAANCVSGVKEGNKVYFARCVGIKVSICELEHLVIAEDDLLGFDDEQVISYAYAAKQIAEWRKKHP